jgi:hypothetical protein
MKIATGVSTPYVVLFDVWRGRWAERKVGGARSRRADSDKIARNIS